MQASREDYWYAHLRFWNDLPLFPREFSLKRTQVYKEQYFFLLNKWYKKQDCYTAVYSENQVERDLYDTLYIEARDETDSLEQILLDRDMMRGAFERRNIAYRDFYSGNRSYRFYLDFPPIPIKNLRATALNFVYDVDIGDLVDWHTVGNRRSIDRIPHTYNSGSGWFSVFYNGHDPDELQFVSMNNLMVEPPVSDLCTSDILKYLRPEDELEYEVFKPADIAFDGMYPDCVLNILSKLKMEHHATNDERVHLTAYLYKFGWSFEDIVNVFRDASDFNPVLAEYYIRQIIGGNYAPYSCSRVKKEMNRVCPFEGSKRYCHYIYKLIKQSKAAAKG